MLFHPTLKESLLYAVFLNQQDFFFNRATWLLSYQLHQLSMDSVMKKALLLEICYAVKTVLNLIICLSSAGKGWPTLYIQWDQHGASNHRSLHSGLRHHHDRFMLGSPWWYIWKYRSEMHVSALIPVAVLAHGRVIGKMQLTQLS